MEPQSVPHINAKEPLPYHLNSTKKMGNIILRYSDGNAPTICTTQALLDDVPLGQTASRSSFIDFLKQKFCQLDHPGRIYIFNVTCEGTCSDLERTQHWGAVSGVHGSKPKLQWLVGLNT
jgi:hypothetical protein